MKKLYFTRHGQTFWNVENKICGATDIALTELGHEQAVAAGQMIREAGYEIDENQRMVFHGDEQIELTTKEFELLMLFVNNKGTAFPRDEIVSKVWDTNYYGSDRVVDDTMRRLRKKMPELSIRTIYGFGYRLG